MTLQDMAKSNAAWIGSSITRLPVEANTFELKPTLLQLFLNNQLKEDEDDDPIDHINNLLEKCDTLKLNNVSEDAIRLRLFPFSLMERAKQWLKSQAVNSYDTCESVSNAFLMKYFPPERTSKLRNEIYTFQQEEDESLHSAWERFREL